MFQSHEFLPNALQARLTTTQVNDPEFAWRAATVRIRRPQLAPTGKLDILAADHPARNVTKVDEDTLAMADRRDYLARTLRVLSSSRVDGVVATMDIIEDLLSIDGLLRAGGGATLLGGESAGDPAPFLRQLESALQAGANVHGRSWAGTHSTRDRRILWRWRKVQAGSSMRVGPSTARWRRWWKRGAPETNVWQRVFEVIKGRKP